MRPKVVVVGLLSQSNNCLSCGSSLQHVSPFCLSCKALQPFPPSPPHFFEVFGLEPALEIDETALRNKFYELSKKVHPDGHALQDPLHKMTASRWSTFINRAYQNLKDSQARTEYVLELFSSEIPTQRALPTDLAEAYFELQERLLENDAQRALDTFTEQLAAEEKNCLKEWHRIAKLWDPSKPSKELISQLQTCWDQQKYLSSIRSNLEKHKKAL